MLPVNSEGRLLHLLRIINIPVEEDWDVLRYDRNIYDYWFGLGLIHRNELDSVLESRLPVVMNPIMNRFFAAVDYYWSPSLYAGRSVVDLGSGYGYLSLWLLLSGADQVHTIGDPERIAFVERLYAAAVERGFLDADRLFFRPGLVSVGDETLSSDILPGSIALVLLNDTLEHINPKVLPYLLDACYADLAPGGRLVSKQHNTSCPRSLRRAHILWDEIDDTQFEETRRDIIMHTAADLAEEAVDQLASATRGLDQEDIHEAVALLRQTGTMPSGYNGRPAVNPLTGEPAEGDTSIRRILAAMRASGFSACVYPAMLDSRRSRWLQPLARHWPSPFLWLHVFDDASVFVGTK